jgi:hypothetical protein
MYPIDQSIIRVKLNTTHKQQMWKFERVLVGPYKGAFMHPFFMRGRKDLCASMTRNPTSGSAASAVSPFRQHFHPQDAAASILLENSTVGQTSSSNEMTNHQFILGKSHDILDRAQTTPPPQKLQYHPQQNYNQHKMQQYSSPGHKTDPFDEAQRLSWAEYTRRQAIMNGIESAEVAIELKNRQPSPNNTLGSSSPSAKNNNNNAATSPSLSPSTPRNTPLNQSSCNSKATRLEQEESWSLLSECLERVMQNNINLDPLPLGGEDTGSIGQQRSGNSSRRHNNVNNLLPLPLDALPQGIDQPATPGQLEALFEEMSGSFE